MYPWEKVDLLLYNATYYSSNYLNIEKFILNPEEWVKVFFATFNNVNDFHESQVSYIKKHSKNETGTKMIAWDKVGKEIVSGTRIARSNKKWSWIPFNFPPLGGRKETVLKILEDSCFAGIVDTKDIRTLNNKANNPESKKILGKLAQKLPEILKDKNRVKAICKRYKKYNGLKKDPRNDDSMVVYSGPVKDGNIFTKRVSCCCNAGLPSGCLYTGDYNAKRKARMEMLKEQYREYWQWIGTIQVPHHGSKHNYNEELNDAPRISVVFAKEQDKHHPAKSVVNKIRSKRGCLLKMVDTRSPIEIRIRSAGDSTVF